MLNINTYLCFDPTTELWEFYKLVDKRKIVMNYIICEALKTSSTRSTISQHKYIRTYSGKYLINSLVNIAEI